MKVSKRDIYTRRHRIARIRFEDQKLTSFSGLVVFQKLFERLALSRRINAACSHLDRGRSYCFGTVVEILVVHVLLGCRKLRELEFYRDDPMVKLVLGLKRLQRILEQISVYTCRKQMSQLKILDLGCGIGEITFPLSYLGHRVVGVDMHPQSIDDCNSRNTFPNATYLVGDIAVLDLRA